MSIRNLLKWLSPSLRRERKIRAKNGEVYSTDLKYRSLPLNQHQLNCLETNRFVNSLAYLKGSGNLYTGKVIDYHKNGQKSHEATYKDGKLEGLYSHWHKNGQKSEELNFKDNQPEGLFMWCEDGNKKFKLSYKDCTLHGQLSSWYSNGQKLVEKTYKHGWLDGISSKWHQNGQKLSEELYKYEGILQYSLYWNSKGEEVDSLEEAEAE